MRRQQTSCGSSCSSSVKYSRMEPVVAVTAIEHNHAHHPPKRTSSTNTDTVNSTGIDQGESRIAKVGKESHHQLDGERKENLKRRKETSKVHFEGEGNSTTRLEEREGNSKIYLEENSKVHWEEKETDSRTHLKERNEWNSRIKLDGREESKLDGKEASKLGIQIASPAYDEDANELMVESSLGDSILSSEFSETVGSSSITVPNRESIQSADTSTTGSFSSLQYSSTSKPDSSRIPRDLRPNFGSPMEKENVEEQEPANYRLNIRISGAGDDSDWCDCDYDINKTPMNSRDTSAVDAEVVDANFHFTPTIKVTSDGRSAYSHQLVLPLETRSQSNGYRSDRLSPTTATPTSIGSFERRGGDNSGASTPRLRLSTPKTTLPPGEFESQASPDSVNGKTTELAEKKTPAELRSGPSSRRTVVMIAGLFVVGLILILSGIIVLSVEEHKEFQIAGAVFLGCGIIFFIICLILQKKNVKKLVNELEKDLYFLNVTDNKIWNFIFHFDEQLTWS